MSSVNDCSTWQASPWTERDLLSVKHSVVGGQPVQDELDSGQGRVD